MKTALFFGIITLLCLWYNLFVSISITNYLKSQGKDVSLFNGVFFIKGKIFKYLPVYKEVTTQHEGRVGALYYQFYLSFIMTLLFLAMGIASL